jgi:benzodiazapine receptor
MVAMPVVKRGGLSALALFVVAVVIAASTGATFHPGSWYEQLAKPAWNPPNGVFAPVWTVLYVAIAVAGWRVWRATGAFVAALKIWVLQLILNTVWSWLFFGQHRPDFAMLDIALLLAAIVVFILTSRRHDRLASWLFVPYLLWVAFASSLNLAIWRLNGA